MKSLKILISAYACRPNMGSEPGVGWNTIREVSKYHQIWVLTREDNRAAIKSGMGDFNSSKPHFIYCEPPQWFNWWHSTQLPHYYMWQIEAFFQARRLYQEICFDAAHHITYVRYSTPSFLSLLPVPFIWGSVGGGEMAPKSYWKTFSASGKRYEILRAIAHRAGEIDPFTGITARRSALVRATTGATAKRLLKLGASRIEIYSESGLSQAEIEILSQFAMPSDPPVRFISMARLLHWKGLHLGIMAFAKADLSSDAEYWIVGEGPEKEKLQALAQHLGVGDQIRFWGRLPREETLNKLSQCHALIHPSLHDSGGWVCLEAMAAGRPIVCLDIGGPSVQVTSETGFLVSANTPEQSVQEMGQALTTICHQPALCYQMGEAGRQRVKNKFCWETKGHQLAQTYLELSTQ